MEKNQGHAGHGGHGAPGPKEALLVIDMLNDFVLERAPLEVPAAREIIPAIRNEIDKARKEGRPVIYVCDRHRPDDEEFTRHGWPPHAVRGTKGAEVIKELDPAAGDVIIEKTTYSGFHGTNLDEVLRSRGITDLKLTGCVTHICVLFTASDAVLRGYRVSVLEEGVAGLEKSDHDAALRIMRSVLGVKIA